MYRLKRKKAIIMGDSDSSVEVEGADVTFVLITSSTIKD
jgi:hypothetical protein